MAVSFRYVAKETTSNLWRNRLMTVAAVLTVAVSLALVGSALVLRQGAARVTTQWQHGVNVLVFLTPQASVPDTITPSQQVIRSQLERLPYVGHCSFDNQTYDFHEAVNLLGVSGGLSPADTPSSLRCNLTDPNQLQAVKSQFGGYAGVAAVTGPSQTVKEMETFIHVTQWVMVGVALILLLSAAVLILNTIRLAIFARRREVSVMKLVGATNWFIRIPFMLEGLVQGLMGALVAVGVVVGVEAVIGVGAQADSLRQKIHLPPSQLLVSCLVVVVVGVLIGATGSYLSIRRHLEI